MNRALKTLAVDSVKLHWLDVPATATVGHRNHAAETENSVTRIRLGRQYLYTSKGETKKNINNNK